MKATTCLSYWLKFNHPDITKCGPGYETTRSFTYWWWECKMVQKMESSLVISNEGKYTLIIQHRICISGQNLFIPEK